MKKNKNHKNYIKNKIFSLMDEVNLILGGGVSVDNFLDQTNLFNDWEKIIPEKEYPIFIITILNNIRRESVIDTILNSLSKNSQKKNQIYSSKKNKLKQISK